MFRQCLPNKSYHLKMEKCSGGKYSKIRITGLTTDNAVGDKRCFVIVKAKSASRTLGNFFVGKLITDKKVMYNILFEEWVRNLKTKFQAIERKIVLIIDN